MNAYFTNEHIWSAVFVWEHVTHLHHCRRYDLIWKIQQWTPFKLPNSKPSCWNFYLVLLNVNFLFLYLWWCCGSQWVTYPKKSFKRPANNQGRFKVLWGLRQQLQVRSIIRFSILIEYLFNLCFFVFFLNLFF